MIFANVRLPDDIRIALEEEKLVIFAGAGISLPPPSNLPTFNGLAVQICGKPVPSGKEIEELGRLADRGTDVHAYAAKRLFNSQTQPTVIIQKLVKPPFDSFLERFPKESCHYITAILKAEEYPFLDEKHLQLHEKLKMKIAGTPELEELEKVFYLRGWKK